MKWISVKNRLPEVNIPVLVYVTEDFTHEHLPYNPLIRISYRSLKFLWDETTNEIKFDKKSEPKWNNISNDNVLFWMPLPNPPNYIEVEQAIADILNGILNK